MDITRVMARLRPGENVAPDLSSYDAMAAGWRGSGNPPSLAELQAAWAEIGSAAAPEVLDAATLDDAKAIVHRLIASEFERRAFAIIGGKWSALERETFERQLAEARVSQATPEASTPFLDGLMLTGETKAGVAASVMAHADALQAAVAPFIKAKREHLRALYSLATIAEVAAYNFTTGWAV